MSDTGIAPDPPPAPGAAAPQGGAEPAPAAAQRTPNATSNTTGAWQGGQPSTINLEAFYRDQQIVQGHQPGRLLQVIKHADAYPPSSALSLRKSALALLQPASSLPSSTLRFTLSSNEHSTLSRTQLENAILAHFNKGRAAFPPLGPIPEQYKQFAPLATGIKLTVNAPTAVKPMAHTYDVSFASDEAVKEALRLGPFMYGGKAIEMDSGTRAVEGLVEFRMILPDLALEGVLIADMFKSAFQQPPTIYHIHRILHTDPSVAGGLPVFKGEVFIYAASAEWVGSRAEVALMLPVEAPIARCDGSWAGDTIPLRTSYEQSWCRKCKFGGHSAEHCMRFPNRPRPRPAAAKAPPPAPKPVPALETPGTTLGDVAAFKTPKSKGKAPEPRVPSPPLASTSTNPFAALEMDAAGEEEELEVVQETQTSEGPAVSPETETRVDPLTARADAPSPTPKPRAKTGRPPPTASSRLTRARTRSTSDLLVDPEGDLGTPTPSASGYRSS